MKKFSWGLRRNQILTSSNTISLCKRFYKSYGFIEKRISYIYHNSLTHGFINRFLENIKICFRHSFLGKITEARQITPVTLDSSRSVQSLINFYKSWKIKIILYVKASSTTDLAKDTRKNLYFFPVSVISIIVITAIITNVFLSIVLQKQIGLWGWLMRGLFLLGAISGLFLDTDWSTIKKSSVFLKKMRMD